MDLENRTPRIRRVAASVQQAAITLREEMTAAERRLWEELRARRLSGLRFRAQHPVGRFILDFYCPACKLIVELDGSVHHGEEEQDAARTAHLAAYGCRVLRFTNDEVMTEMPTVLARIQAAAQEEKGEE
ncbi:MAG: endonuclease domain-containing protein [Janthinobacterium lividum]